MNAQASRAANNAYKYGVQRVLLLTLCFNVVVVIGKLTAGLLAGSLSIISDAIHSAVDSFNNIVGLVVVKYATGEPDERHPHGRAKYESLAAFTVAIFLFVTCYEIGGSALKRLFSREAAHPEVTSLTFSVMIATIIVNLIVATYEKRAGKKLMSEFLIADAIHTQSDVLISCSVLVGLFVIKLGYVWLDSVVSLLVAALVGQNCYQIWKMTVPVLVDTAPVPPAHIAAIVESVPGVHSVHDVRSRAHGCEIFIEMHLRLSPLVDHDHFAGHAITEEVARWLEEEFGRVTATIQVEPYHSEICQQNKHIGPQD